jgi:hypothetical protein
MARTLSPRHTIQRIRRALAEMNHGQRRAFEARTCLRSGNTLEQARDKAMIANLEAHWRM